MPSFVKSYVKWVDAVNNALGKAVLYLVFGIMAILLASTLSRYFLDRPVIWGVEMAQFAMAVYYTLGGGFALLLNSHVRMDVLYSRWGAKRRARVDCLTFLCLACYLGLLLYGGLSSTAYSIRYHQHNNTAWAPQVAPVKILLVIGIFLTLLQAISEFFKDVAQARGVKLCQDNPDRILLESSMTEKSALESPPSPARPAAPLLPEGLEKAA
ncbi:MAG: TRAP transporter small permease subunit [Deltaproteobacteria bacterium]|jgi:TRAP-type mannitol/chloroaromatic compound transport system permease small subunit|nr:TRAP transporter small permease subunit [Deltaproteobacteria bacterium]